MQKSNSTIKTLIILICLSFLIAPLRSYAKGTEKTPDFIAGSVKIDAEGLINQAEKETKLIIIDSRINSDRQQGFIEGSISLPDTQTSCTTLSKKLPHKNFPVIFYCNGPKCGRSVVAVKVAVLCGYKNIYWFRGGFEEWKQKKYPYITK